MNAEPNARPAAIQLKCPPIKCVRIALVGLGNRGTKTLARYSFIDNAQIVCIADIDPERLEQANRTLRQGGRPEALAICGKEAWKEACEMPGVDLVYICTEWQSHAEMAVYAMLHGKHVAVEVPAATTVEECWLLVRTAERTRRHCFMTENCCYDIFALETLEMKRQGVFGEITHCEGAYIHNLKLDGDDAGWIERACLLHGGNPYPTHGIGPIAQLLGFHRTDRMHHLVSITSDGAHGNGLPLGRVNTTIIKTVRGRSIILQLDVTTPRPYNRLQTICGTKAFAQKYPLPTIQTADGLLTGSEATDRMRLYDTSEAARIWRQGKAMNVPNAMNYTMDVRLIHCLNNGLPLDIDVYDAAEWSCLAELTKLSAAKGGESVAVPDFTKCE